MEVGIACHEGCVFYNCYGIDCLFQEEEMAVVFNYMKMNYSYDAKV